MRSISSSSLFVSLFFGVAASVRADLVTSVPGPDDQGGMLMPMVTIEATAGSGANPAAGTVRVSFNPPATPILQDLQTWSPGDWFAADAAWRADLGSPTGLGGTPATNAGAGARFNNQYGFMFMNMNSMMMAAVPAGKSLAIRLVSVSSPLLESYNYGASANRWDRVFSAPGDQVLWNGSMWHNYFVVPAEAAAGTYRATFEIFVANTPFTGGTGFAQYDSTARSAIADPSFAPATLDYVWTVAAVPEPAAAAALFGLGALGLVLTRRRVRARALA